MLFKGRFIFEILDNIRLNLRKALFCCEYLGLHMHLALLSNTYMPLFSVILHRSGFPLVIRKTVFYKGSKNSVSHNTSRAVAKQGSLTD